MPDVLILECDNTLDRDRDRLVVPRQIARGLIDCRGILISMFLAGSLLILVAEIASFVVVAQQISFLWALVILLVVSALGPFIVMRVGVGVAANTRERLARGEVPSRELLDGLVLLVAGALICVPGYITDAFGLLLMIGPLRRLVIQTTGHWLARRIPTIRIRSWKPTDASRPSIGEDVSPPLGPSLPPRGPDELGP